MGTPANARAVFEKNRKEIETPDGCFMVRAVSLLTMTFHGFEMPFGPQSQKAAKEMSKKPSGREPDYVVDRRLKQVKDALKKYCELLLMLGVVQDKDRSYPKIVVGPDETTDPGLNVIHISDLSNGTADRLIAAIEDLNGWGWFKATEELNLVEGISEPFREGDGPDASPNGEGLRDETVQDHQ